VQLLQHITRARQLGRLEQLVQQYGPKFDGVHVAAAMSMLPKLHQPARPGSRLSGQKLKQRRQIPAKLLGQLQVRIEWVAVGWTSPSSLERSFHACLMTHIHISMA
jgi:hypothetical protein